MIASKNSGQRGAALVEFVLVFPLLLLFLFGIIEFSIMLYDNAVITNASREAAREWIEYKDETMDYDEVSAVAFDYASNRLITFGPSDPDNLKTTLRVNGGPDIISGSTSIPVDRGDMLTVEVTYTYGFLILPALIKNFFPDGLLDISAETVMRAE